MKKTIALPGLFLLAVSLTGCGEMKEFFNEKPKKEAVEEPEKPQSDLSFGEDLSDQERSSVEEILQKNEKSRKEKQKKIFGF